MFFSSLRARRTSRKKVICILVAFALIIGGCAIYVSDYYRADSTAIDAFCSVSTIKQSTLEDGSLVFEPESPTAGFIFYPGGKVEHTAYVPLMYALAERGILSVLIEMPFNLAVLDVNAADGIREQLPYVESWYIGGHSLGGSMAASYLAKNSEQLDGLILLGSYSTASLTSSDARVLSIYGSEDGVMNRDKYEKYKANLPDSFTEQVIEGGCHAYFGMYGEQSGDGEPSITVEEQIDLTCEYIFNFINMKGNG